MNRNKIIITVVLIIGLLLFVALIGLVLVLVFTYDVMYWSDGIISLLAFVVAAFIFGYVMNKAISRIKRLWE